MLRRIGGNTLRCFTRRSLTQKQLVQRNFSAHYSPSSALTSTPVSPLAGLTVELDRLAPRFEIPASHVTILDSPTTFYETLKNKIRKAQRRIYLSTLYIGKTEHELLETLDEALRGNPNLRVSVLTDALRGTREAPNPSCASILASLVAKHGPDRVEIHMFHTPNLTGLRKKLIPRRINEGWGLQHMKLYGVDDEIILSGANLSNDYFTNRVDRYHVFKSQEIADYYAAIHHAVCSLSFQVLPDPHSDSGFLLDWPETNRTPSPLDDREAFISHASKVLHPLIQPTREKSAPGSLSAGKAFVYPVAQFTPVLKPDTSTEFHAVTSILQMLSSYPAFSGSRWLFTAGYFNIHPVLSSLLVASTSHSPDAPSATRGTVLTASPWANGFYGSPGVSGMLPAAYTHLSARFLDRVAAAQATNSIALKEWRRGTVGEPNGWTYHAKGLWITLPNEEYPSLTFVGSSNYTKRSYNLDLEVGALVVTTDETLQRRFGEESQWLQNDAQAISRDDLRRIERRVGWNVRLAMWIVEMVGGAL